MKYIIKKLHLTNVVRNSIKLVLKLFWLFPINEKNIVFISYGGQQYSCNTKYISEYLSSNNDVSYNIVWVFKEPSKFKWLDDKGYKIIKYGSLIYLKTILTAKVIITNNNLSSYLPIRKKQTVINTWHGGGAYKKVVSDDDIKAKKTIEKTFKIYDLFLSPCKKNTELMIKGTFGYTGKILEIGYPRNDIFFSNGDSIKQKIYTKFNLSKDDKILLYAPTFRENSNEETYNIDIRNLKKVLEDRFEGNWIIMMRAHHSIKDKFNFDGIEDIIIDVTSYDDMQELLLAADILITDYSSCIWDFSLMYKPSILLVKDLDSYKKERDFYVPIEDWNFPIVKSDDELMEYIRNFDEVESRNNIEKHLKEFGSYETGEATKIIANQIKKLITE